MSSRAAPDGHQDRGLWSSAAQYARRQSMHPEHVAMAEPETPPTAEAQLDLALFNLDERVSPGTVANGAARARRDDPHVPLEGRRDDAGEQWARLVARPPAGHSVAGSPNVENTEASNVVISTTRSCSIRSTSRVTPRNVGSPHGRR
jgi:hypothetical protein